MSDERITLDELREMFGDDLPMSAVNLLINERALTLAEVRTKLAAIAADFNENPPSIEVSLILSTMKKSLDEQAAKTGEWIEERSARDWTIDGAFDLLQIAEAVAKQLGLPVH